MQETKFLQEIWFLKTWFFNSNSDARKNQVSLRNLVSKNVTTQPLASMPLS
jgi:hypothetical protein